MAIVYVVQEPMKIDSETGKLVKKMDLRPAWEFGELEFLLTWEEIKVLTPQPMLRLLRHKLRNYSSDDFLLMIGHPIAMSLTAIVASEINAGGLQMLYWDKKQRNYKVVKANSKKNSTLLHPEEICGDKGNRLW